MTVKKRLRLISFIMFVVAIVFVLCALSAPNLGHTIYFGSYAFGAEQWRVCYGVYVLIMILLFVSSFFTKERGKHDE